MRRAGYDDRTDFTGIVGTDNDEALARMLQEQELNPNRSRIEDVYHREEKGHFTIPDKSEYLGKYVEAEARNQRNQRELNALKSDYASKYSKVESDLRALKDRAYSPRYVYDPDIVFDRLYRWGIDLIPDYDYIKRLRMQNLLEKLIRAKLHEPEDILKDEIRRLIYKSQPAAPKRAPRRSQSKKKTAAKKRTAKKSPKKKR